MAHCAHIIEGWEAEVQCSHPAIGECSDPNCLDEVCNHHGQFCEGCGNFYCDLHIRNHFCSKKRVA